MENEREKIEQTLYRLLDYRAEHDVDNDSLLIMLSLLNLMGLVNALNRSGAGTLPTGSGNLQALLPLLAIAATGMGGRSGGQSGGQINPAMLLSLLGGMQGGGQNDLAGLLGLVGPLLGSQGQAASGKTSGDGKKTAPAPRPVQREINLDRKNKPAANVVSRGKEKDGETRKKNDREGISGPNEVLEWKFGAG